MALTKLIPTPQDTEDNIIAAVSVADSLLTTGIITQDQYDSIVTPLQAAQQSNYNNYQSLNYFMSQPNIPGNPINPLPGM